MASLQAPHEYAYDCRIAEQQRGMNLMYNDGPALRAWLQEKLQWIGFGSKQVKQSGEKQHESIALSENGLTMAIRQVLKKSVRNLHVSIDGTTVTITGETDECETSRTVTSVARRYLANQYMTLHNNINVIAVGG